MCVNAYFGGNKTILSFELFHWQLYVSWCQERTSLVIDDGLGWFRSYGFLRSSPIYIY